jgi:hypothetical protein
MDHRHCLGYRGWRRDGVDGTQQALRDGAGENDQTGLLAARIAFVIADDPVGAGLVAS